MHLVIVSPFPPTVTGVGQYGYHITRALAKLGCFSRITVLAGSSTNGERVNHLGLTEVEYCWEPGQLNARQTILSRVKRLSPDLVWFNLRMGMFGESPLHSVSGLLSPMLVHWMGYPTVVTFHEMVELSDLVALKAPGGVLAPLGAQFITSLATQADVVCLTMQDHLDWFAKTRPEVECVHIPLGAVSDPLLLDEPDSMELLMFNMLAPFKGVQLLLETFPRLRKIYPNLRLSIAGEEHPRFPGYAKYLRERFADVDGVCWLGKIADDDVIELFRRANLVILPYSASTGSSSVLYSAATWGRAIVASDLHEIRELVQEQNFQIEFFKNGNAKSLQDAIHALLASPERRRQQVLHNFRSIQNASIEITCHSYVRAFNRALEKRRSQKRIPMPYFEAEAH